MVLQQYTVESGWIKIKWVNVERKKHIIILRRKTENRKKHLRTNFFGWRSFSFSLERTFKFLRSPDLHPFQVEPASLIGKEKMETLLTGDAAGKNDRRGGCEWNKWCWMEIWCEIWWERGLSQIGAYAPAKPAPILQAGAPEKTDTTPEHGTWWHLGRCLPHIWAYWSELGGCFQITSELEECFQTTSQLRGCFQTTSQLVGCFWTCLSLEGVFELHLSLEDVFKLHLSLEGVSNYICNEA